VLTVSVADRDPVPAADRGLAYGDGLFETIRMVGNRAVLRHLHLDRIAGDAHRLGITVSRSDLEQALADAIQYFQADFSAAQQDAESRNSGWILKMILTRGSGGRGYRPPESTHPHLVLSASELPPMPDQRGVQVSYSSVPLVVNPLLAGIKTLNRLEQVMASREFTGGEWELLMRDLSGAPVEGTRTNLIARLGDEWLTPPVESVAVAGVMRQYVIERLKNLGERVSQRLLPADLVFLPEFQGLYLLNSVFGVVPVRTLDGVNLPVDASLATISDPLETLE